MGFAAHMLGGAMQGLGKGMVAQGEIDAQTRRDAALAALKSQSDRENNAMTADREAAKDERQHSSALTLQSNRQEFESKTAAAGVTARKEEREDTQAHETGLLTVKQSFERNENEKTRSAENERAFGKPVAEYVDEITGDVTQVYRTPQGNKTEVYKGIARKQPTSSSNLLALPTNPGSSPGKPATANRAPLSNFES